MSDRPRLSVLLPAFSYPEGIKRILSSFAYPYRGQIEILVFDDSPNDDVADAVTELGSGDGLITYRHNRPSLGATGNWNALLDSAQGEYCLLMHHDEYPLSTGFWSDLLKLLDSANGIDLVIMDCILQNPESRGSRRHLPMWLRRYIVQRHADYLLRRNVIGPVSSIVFRRAVAPRFDEKLKWFVDVDFYYQIIRRSDSIQFAPHIQIGSLPGRAGSITRQLGKSVKRIASEEGRYLASKHRLRLERNPANLAADLFWYLFRAVQRVFQAFR
jgi:glycosyltransferase involved in cell wall biosynthesis